MEPAIKLAEGPEGVQGEGKEDKEGGGKEDKDGEDGPEKEGKKEEEKKVRVILDSKEVLTHLQKTPGRPSKEDILAKNAELKVQLQNYASDKVSSFRMLMLMLPELLRK